MVLGVLLDALLAQFLVALLAVEGARVGVRARNDALRLQPEQPAQVGVVRQSVGASHRGSVRPATPGTRQFRLLACKHANQLCPGMQNDGVRS